MTLLARIMLDPVDWAIIVGFLGVSLLIGVVVSRRAGKNSSEFFLSGRSMPWWLLGFSMVATTFSTDTPNLVTDIVRQNGVSGNWVWWAFLLTGMLTVFVYAKLWRRTGVMTDVEFYELRYSGKSAAFLRGFRALYLGVFFNVVIMAAVSLAAIKIGSVMLGLAPWQTLLVAATVTVIFSALGGFRGVLLTDFLLFFIAMIGAVAAAVVAVNVEGVGGMGGLLSNPSISDKLSLVPSMDFSNVNAPNSIVFVFIIPLTIQWWSVWYPGAEPGGGGYIAQRMLAAKDQRHAVGATLFFNAAHYALRPWPWIIVALASLVIFPMDSKQDRDAAKELLDTPAMVAAVEKIGQAPDSVEKETRDKVKALQLQAKGLTALAKAFPKAEKLGHDMAYPAMLTYLPHGLLGLVVASLVAAYMSTISTHLNWGSSYVVNDFYKRFVNPQAPEKTLVRVGRVSTVVMMVLAGLLALLLSNSLQAFDLMLQIGAGTGLLFILRWFWWRINAFSELTGMVVSFLVAFYFTVCHTWIFGEIDGDPFLQWKLVIGVGLTTVSWIFVTMLTPPTDPAKLRDFYRLARPGGPGWRSVVEAARRDGESIDDGEGGWTVPLGLLCMMVGCMAVYGALFATGMFIYGHLCWGAVLAAVAVASTIFLMLTWRRVSADKPTPTETR